MTKKSATKRQLSKPPAEKRPQDEPEYIDAGTLESGIYEPDEEISQEFNEAQRVSSGGRDLINRKYREAPDSPEVAGGDPENNFYEASMSGDESVVGGNPSPEIDNVDLIGRAVGLEYQDNEPLHTAEKVRERDKRRWELDAASSENYEERLRQETKGKGTTSR